jgi:hypothetical protein
LRVGIGTPPPPAAERESDSGIVFHSDAALKLHRLISELPARYAEVADQPHGQRQAAMSKLLQETMTGAAATDGRALLAAVRATFATGLEGPSAGGSAPDPHLADAALGVLRGLSTRFLGDLELATTADLRTFGRLVAQSLDTMVKWLSTSLESRREFGRKLGNDVTLMLGKADNLLKDAADTAQIAQQLLDWRGAENEQRNLAALEEVFRDLTLHQMGLLAGAKECVREVLRRLDPTVISTGGGAKPAGWLAKATGADVKVAWETFVSTHKNLLEEQTRLFTEVVSPMLRKGYLEAHSQALGEAAAQASDSGPTNPVQRPGPGSS